MNVFRKLFGGKESNAPEPSSPVPRAADQLEKNPHMVKVYDAYGNEMYLTREDWKAHVLLPSLEEHRDDPDRLSAMLIQALHDGFAADVVGFAQHLQRTDPIPERGAVVLAIVYMQTGRLADAERTLAEVLARHGEDGVVLTNLAKVYALKGEARRAESVLWHALEVDPNQDNGFEWYVAIHRERGGDAAALEAIRRIAQLPGSWRAQLWLAREALQNNDLANAMALYADALQKAGDPPPADVLLQMSGDLGNHGCLNEVVELVAPRFNPDLHGIAVGHNLIRAFFSLGRVEEARTVLNQLYACQRPDWAETLGHWTRTLAEAEVTRSAPDTSLPIQLLLLSIERPLWAREHSPFSELCPAKEERAQTIMFLGSAVVSNNSSTEPQPQLSDPPGRLSRAIPLWLAERTHLSTTARGIAVIPWVQGRGFAVFGRSVQEDSELLARLTHGGPRPDWIVTCTLDVRRPVWCLRVDLLRVPNFSGAAPMTVDLDPSHPGPAVLQAASLVENWIVRQPEVRRTPHPDWYQVPSGREFSDYLVRLEEMLVIQCSGQDFLSGGAIYGEHEMLQGIIRLCARLPNNYLVRMLLVEELAAWKKVRPALLSRYGPMLMKLQREHPLGGPVGRKIMDAFAAILADDEH